MLSTCICVCLCVYMSVTTLPAASFISTLKLRYKQLYYGILFIVNLWIKTASFSVICLRQQRLVLLQQHFTHFCNDRQLSLHLSLGYFRYKIISPLYVYIDLGRTVTDVIQVCTCIYI